MRRQFLYTKAQNGAKPAPARLSLPSAVILHEPGGVPGWSQPAVRGRKMQPRSLHRCLSAVHNVPGGGCRGCGCKPGELPRDKAILQCFHFAGEDVPTAARRFQRRGRLLHLGLRSVGRGRRGSLDSAHKKLLRKPARPKPAGRGNLHSSRQQLYTLAFSPGERRPSAWSIHTINTTGAHFVTGPNESTVCVQL